MSTPRHSRRRYRHAALAVAGLCAALALSGCASRSGQPKTAKDGTTTVTLVSSITGTSYLAVTAAEKEGFFKKNNLNVKQVSVASTDKVVAALLSGQATFGTMLAEGAITTNVSNASLKIIGCLQNQDQHRLYVPRSITSVDQLKGKKIAIIGPGNGTEIEAKYLMDHSGVGAGSAQYIAVGPQTAQIAALKANQVQAALLVPPYSIKAESMGFHSIAAVQDILPNLTTSAIVSTASALGKGDAAQKFLRAITQSTQWLLSHEQQAIALLASTSGIDQTTAQQAFAQAKNAYSTTSQVNVQALQQEADLYVKYGVLTKKVDAASIYDASYVPGK